MKSFFDKTESVLTNYQYIKFSIKYNLPMTKKLKLVDTLYINERILNKLDEILKISSRIIIDGFNLKYLPDDFNNEDFNLDVFKFDETYSLPNNWNINQLKFFRTNKNINIPDSFKCKKIEFDSPDAKTT